MFHILFLELCFVPSRCMIACIKLSGHYMTLRFIKNTSQSKFIQDTDEDLNCPSRLPLQFSELSKDQSSPPMHYKFLSRHYLIFMHGTHLNLKIADSTIFMHGMHAKGKIQRKGYFPLSDFLCMCVCDQRYRRRFTNKRRPRLQVLANYC